MEYQQLNLPTARNNDPLTSHIAGVGVRVRSGSQRALLLSAYAEHAEGLTDEEAGLYTGLAGKAGCCYWKRSSELRQMKLIESTGSTRFSRANERQQVCRITAYGLAALRDG
jgi:hypothetical protein